MAWRGNSILTMVLAICVLAGTAPAQEREVTISGKEIVERLSRIEEGQKNLERRLDEFRKSVDQRFAEVQKNVDQRFAEVQKNVDQRFAEMQKNVDLRFVEMDRRFGDIDRRFGEMDRRFGEIDRRISELHDFLLWGFGINFAGMFTLIGFVLWDRRTALVPAVRRIDEVHDKEQRVESALRDFAKQSPDLANSLKKSGLL